MAKYELKRVETIRFMKTLLLLFCLVCSTLSFAGSLTTISANNNLIEYTGRIDFANPNAPTFSYSGVSIRACFTGTSLAIIMDDNVGDNYYNLILDGQLLDTLKITKGKKTYKIAEGLVNKIHEIEVFKRTEEMFGKTQFLGFVIDGKSALVPIINKREKLIEFIGNSITCGYGNEGVNGGKFGPTTENHYMTYAAITSRNFNARHLAVCKSGIGIFRNWDGPAEGNDQNMTTNYTRTYIWDENPKYSFSDTPDLVCIDLGTNDFSTTGGDSARYVNNYFRLIDTIQSKYSKPEIVCLLGPMMSDPVLSNVRRYLKFIADSANRKMNGKVSFFEMSQQTGSLGIDSHPTVAQNQKNGAELTNYISALKGWKICPLIVNASLNKANEITVEFNTPIADSLNDFSGFKVLVNNKKYAISSASLDVSNNKILNVKLKKSIDPQKTVTLSYASGIISSTDMIPVGTINKFRVDKRLVDSNVIKGNIIIDEK